MKSKVTRGPSILTPEFRLAFPALFEPRPAPGNENKLTYSAIMLFAKKNADGTDNDMKWLKDHYTKVALTQWPGLAVPKPQRDAKWAEKFPGCPRSLTLPIADGDSDNAAAWEGFAGNWYVRIARNEKVGAPVVVGPDGKVLTEPTRVYGGVWARAKIAAFTWSFQGKNGVSIGMEGVQVLRDDDAFGGGGNVLMRSAGMFEPVAAAAENPDNYTGADVSVESGDNDPSL